MEEDITLGFRLAGVALLVAVSALWLWAAPVGAEIKRGSAAAVPVALLVLVSRRLRWRCVSCGARYRRRTPPRASAQSSGAPANGSGSD